MRRLAASLALLAALAVFVPVDAAPGAAVFLAVTAALLLEPAALRRAWGVRTLAVLALASLAVGGLVAWSAGLPSGVAAGVAVLLRLLVLVLLGALAARHIGADGLRRVARLVGAERLGLVLGLALNSLPHLADAWRDSWLALAVRSRGARPQLRHALRLAETLLAHAGRIADEAAAAASLRGHRALVAPPLTETAIPHLVVVTGPSGSGKTTAIAGAAASLSASGVAVAGFVQEGVTVSGKKTAFSVRELSQGEVAPLALRVAAGDGQYGTPFRFDPRGFAAARQALDRAVPGGVVVVDEIGPVELRGGGHMPALRRALRRRRPAVCVLAVRRPLMPSLLARLAASSVEIVDVSGDPAAAETIASAVRASAGAGRERPATG